MTVTGSAAAGCPFCGGPPEEGICGRCGRDVSTPRWICRACKAHTPMPDHRCLGCGTRRVNDLRWKIPAIVAMFAAALVAAVLLNTA